MHASAASLRLAFSHRWAQRAQSACLSSSSNVAVSPMATPLARRGAAGTPMTPLSTFKAPSCSGGAIGVDVGAAAWRMHGAVRGLVQVYDDMRAAWEIILRHELPATGRLPQAHSFGPVSAPGGGIFRGDGASQELCALANRRLTEAFASLVAVLSRLELCLASILSASETADWAIDIEAALAGLEEAIIEWSCAWEAKLDADCRVGLVHSPVCNLRLAKSSVDICHLGVACFLLRVLWPAAAGISHRGVCSVLVLVGSQPGPGEEKQKSASEPICALSMLLHPSIGWLLTDGCNSDTSSRQSTSRPSAGQP